jgi:hypothetical protein
MHQLLAEVLALQHTLEGLSCVFEAFELRNETRLACSRMVLWSTSHVLSGSVRRGYIPESEGYNRAPAQDEHEKTPIFKD